MKKIYTLILLVLLISNVGKAQLSLTQGFNEPSIGNTENRKSYDTTSAIPKNTGLNQVWNFSTLSTNTVAMVTYSYVTPASVSGGTAFPTATIARTDGTNNEFYKTNVAQYELLGTKQGSTSLTFTNSAVVAIWPITYGYTNTDPVSGSAKITTTITLNAPFNGNITVNGTGTGTLQLPFGINLTNCLQLKSVLNGTATFTVPIIGTTIPTTVTNTSYQYYHSTQKFSLLTVNINSVMTPTASYNSTSTSITLNNDIFAGIKEYGNSISGLNLYPNPSSGNFYLVFNNENAEAVSVEISNYIGQTVKNISFENTKGFSVNEINVSSLGKGIYFVKTIVGNNSTTKKLIIE